MLELESGRGGEGRLVIQRQRDCERARETEQEREGRERERAGTMSTAQLPAQSAEI